MTFKRYHLEDGFTEAHYDMMLPDTEPVLNQQLGCAKPALEQHDDCQKLPYPPTPGPTPSACVRTFNITELAEEIFLHLSPENLLCRVQRVCRQWRRMVESSELIQQYLFFKPISFSYEFVEWRALISRGELQHTGGLGDEIESAETWATGVPVLENPWLYLLSGDTERTKLLQGYPEASWRRMLLTQPPRKHETGRDWLLQDSVNLTRYSGWREWQPVLEFDTLRQTKKFRRQHESFVEVDLTD